MNTVSKNHEPSSARVQGPCRHQEITRDGEILIQSPEDDWTCGCCYQHQHTFINVYQGLGLMSHFGDWFHITKTNICWKLYPQYLGDVKHRDIETNPCIWPNVEDIHGWMTKKDMIWLLSSSWYSYCVFLGGPIVPGSTWPVLPRLWVKPLGERYARKNQKATYAQRISVLQIDPHKLQGLCWFIW